MALRSRAVFDVEIGGAIKNLRRLDHQIKKIKDRLEEADRAS